MLTLNFISVVQTQILNFCKKFATNKMSLQLVSDLSNEIETIVDVDGNPWFKRAHVGKFLGLKQIYTSVEGLDKCEMPTRNDIKAMVSNPYPWPGPKDQQSKTDMLLSAYGVIYAIIKSKKPKVYSL